MIELSPPLPPMVRLQYAVIVAYDNETHEYVRYRVTAINREEMDRWPDPMYVPDPDDCGCA